MINTPRVMLRVIFGLGLYDTGARIWADAGQSYLPSLVGIAFMCGSMLWFTWLIEEYPR